MILLVHGVGGVGCTMEHAQGICTSRWLVTMLFDQEVVVLTKLLQIPVLLCLKAALLLVQHDFLLKNILLPSVCTILLRCWLAGLADLPFFAGLHGKLPTCWPKNGKNCSKC